MSASRSPPPCSSPPAADQRSRRRPGHRGGPRRQPRPGGRRQRLEIFVSGSSTVEPISTGVAEAFKAANPDFNFTVEGPGTGDGFKKFCAGETDISDASRPIKDEEAEACADAGIEYVELKVAYRRHVGPDLASTTPRSPASASPTSTRSSAPSRTGFAKWTDARGPRQGARAPTPSSPTPTSRSPAPARSPARTTRFVELAHRQDRRGARPGRRRPAPTTPPRANDNAIIDGIAGSPTSLGWVGFAFAEENKDKVSEIQVAKDANGTCVAPTAETIADGSYPLSRRLFIYVNKAKAAENPAVAAYVDFYLAEGTIATVLETVPYVSLPADALAATPRRLGRRAEAPSSSANGPGRLEARPVRLRPPRLRTPEPHSPMAQASAGRPERVSLGQPPPATPRDRIVRGCSSRPRCVSIVISASSS